MSKIKFNEQQQKAVDVFKGATSVIAAAGSGKALPDYEIVKTPTGDKKIGELVVGDEVLNSYGGVSSVQGVYPQGKKEIWEVEFSDGVVIESSKDHLWNYQTASQRTRKKQYNTATLEDIYKLPLKAKAGEYKRWNLYIPIAQPVIYEEKEYFIPPYTLGVLIGDGCSSGISLSISNSEKDIIVNVNNDLKQTNYEATETKTVKNVYTVKMKKQTNVSPLRLELIKIGLYDMRSHEKFIPKEYLLGSINQRLELLKGLIDTDGECNGSNYTYSTSSRKLGEDVVELVQGLGMTAYIADRQTYYTHEGKKKAGRPSYRIYIKSNNMINKIHKSKKHESTWKKGQSSARRTIRRITPTNKKTSMTCIKVDAKDSLFLTKGFVVTHNTAMLIGRVDNLIKKHNVHPSEILTVTFTRDTSKDLTKKLNELGHKDVVVGTFHAVCGRILRSEGIYFNRFNQIKQYQIENVFKKINRSVDTKSVMEFIDFQKNYGIGKDDKFVNKSSIYQNVELRRYYKAYEDFKKKKKLHDFNDYLLKTLEILENNPNKYTFEHVLVDEHQDTNQVQNDLLGHWVRDNNIFCVYDFRQGLYGFRGGSTRFAMDFDKYWDNPQFFNVSTNYRSTEDIIINSNKFIKKYYGHLDYYEDAIAHKKEESNITVQYHANEFTESEYIGEKIQKLVDGGVDLNEIAILYRNNSQADYVENELRYREIPYDIASDGSFFKRREVAGILAVLRLIQDIEDDSAFETIYKSLRAEPLKFFSNLTFSNTQKKAQEEGISLFDAFKNVGLSGRESKQDVREFINIISNLSEFSVINDSVEELIEQIIVKFKLRILIRENYDNVDDREERLLSIEVLKKFVKNMRLQAFINFAYSSTEKKEDDGTPKVQFKSCHRSKGLEFEHVFLIGVKDDTFPSSKATILEEAMLFYVAITRSKRNLSINGLGGKARFVEEYLGNETEIYSLDDEEAKKTSNENTGFPSDEEILHNILNS